MTSILKAESITKQFNDKESVLKGISLEIAKDSFTVMLGPSGSGKSTLLNILSGLLKPTKGQVWFGEKLITNMTESQIADWNSICRFPAAI